jgi:succinate-semialdehyde dehydrogenase / glutarate-semialdehyde dehydrogenase
MAEQTIKSVNPANDTVIEEFTPHTPAEVTAVIDTAHNCFADWRKTSFEHRAELMMKAADILEANADRYAADMTAEMGKPLSQAKAEVNKCAWVCRHYAEQAAIYLDDEPMESSGQKAYVRHLPLGVILAVMPWNFPFWQVFRFAAPILMAGNTGLLKHASNVFRSALNIEEVFKEAGFPEGAFQTLLIGSRRVEGVIKDDRVKAVSLTGSGPAGGAVAGTAGKELKPTLLELGGSDAFIVMPSADIEKALDTALKARTQNNGQSCIAAKRFFVHADVYDAFKTGFEARFKNLKVGDPTVDGTDIGPLATAAIRDELIEQVEKSVEAGASVFKPGNTLPDTGNWFDPCIIIGAPEGSPSADEEMFGPVANLWKVENLDEAIRRANDNIFGLGSVIFTQDETEMTRAVNELEAGATFVNSMVASDPRLPFGGIKQSGYGRELAADGIKAFVNRKTVFIA